MGRVEQILALVAATFNVARLEIVKLDLENINQIRNAFSMNLIKMPVISFFCIINLSELLIANF